MSASEQTIQRIGRPLAEFDRLTAKRLLRKGMPVLQIARYVGVHRNTLHRHISELRDFRPPPPKPGVNALVLVIAWRRVIEQAYYSTLITPYTTRQCNKCGLVKSLMRGFYFKPVQEIYRGTCKECCKARARIVWHEVGRLRPRLRGSAGAPLRLAYPFLLTDQLEGAALLRLINNSVPKFWKEEIRSEVCQELALAVLTGEISESQIGAYVRQFAAKQYKLIADRRHVSLDAPIKEGSRYTLLDVLAAPEAKNHDNSDDEDMVEFTRGACALGMPYGGPLADCESASDYAERLRESWSANRFTTGHANTYGTFSGRGQGSYADTEYDALRRKYKLINGKPRAFAFEVERYGGAWSIENALPEELREQHTTECL